ncbi:calcium-binding protein [Falsiroseomonas sp. HW251]|uniref:calcium-binding protein n=1 Tax=Falsiroseomonas sp. HW251 TaxID=3390998 RepID=UPI003D31AD3F
MAVVVALDEFGRGVNMTDVGLASWLLDGPATPTRFFSPVLQGSFASWNYGVATSLMNVDSAPIAGFLISVSGLGGVYAVTGFQSQDAAGNPLVTIGGLSLSVTSADLRDMTFLGTDFLTGSDTVTGNRFSDVLRGSAGQDSLVGGDGGDILKGDGGADTLSGEAGSNVLIGGAGTDVALLPGTAAGASFFLGGTFTLVIAADGSAHALAGVESVRFGGGAVASLTLAVGDGGSFSPTFARTDLATGTATTVGALDYIGPVDYLALAFLGTAGGEAVGGTRFADFINGLGGDDAVSTGAGTDVVDGGTGSNFITGGADRDVFFLDGRGGTTTWSTITDWEVGEQLSVWGWKPGVSTASWVDQAGATGFQGVTMHGDLNGDGLIETSVTWTGQSRAVLPKPLEFDGLLWFL